MSKKTKIQIGIILAAAIFCGFVNNLRDSTQIELVKDWPDFSEVRNAGETPSDTAMPPSEDERPAPPAELDGDQTRAMVLDNQGITTIGIEQAKQVFDHCADFTFWIDARDEELYNEGHIKDAHLLYFYRQHDYLPQVLASIEEKNPMALVIYCKGKECTDSHLLAEDLAAQGFNNLFVYKDGFDDWYKAGFPIAGSLAQTAEDETPAPVQEDQAVAAEIQAEIFDNQGVTTIGLNKAQQIFRYGAPFTLWIDARDPELFAEGRIKGAQLLHYYEKNRYLPDIMAKAEETQPVALVVYCKGKECTDSHLLAEELVMEGFNNIFVYKDGFDDWYKAGFPIEGTLAETPPVAPLAPSESKPGLSVEKPDQKDGMYLEHILRDGLPFLLGMLMLLIWGRIEEKKEWLWVASLVVGAFFIWAALPKIASPQTFAKDIWNYDLAPGFVINLTALIMPWLELLAGVGLVTGLARKGSGYIVSALLLLFIVLISINVLRGHDFNCGCTSSDLLLSEAFFKGWNEKYMLLLRDAGLLVMSAMAALKTRDNRREQLSD